MKTLNSTTDLILDFDGGSIQSGQGYEPPLEANGGFNGFNFTGFTPFSNSDNSPGNANEQIFQILAGVREDFADFNVNVIWDDRGVNSPFFDNKDTVVQITNNTITDIFEDVPFFVLLGLTNVDVPGFTGNSSIQAQRDTGFVFSGLLGFFDLQPVEKLFEIINITSRLAGFSFGISNASEPDSEGRQIVSNAEISFLDTRFSPEPLNHEFPEEGVIYSEVERLNETVGPASVLPGDTQSSQTISFEPKTFFLGTIGGSDVLTGSGGVDFLGDRDAFRFEIQEPGEYTIIQSTNESSLTPVVTLWDASGSFVSVGNVGTDGVSSITFNADAGTYYAVGGSEADRQLSGVIPDSQTGAYDVFVVGGAFENNQIGSPLDDRITGDAENNFLTGKAGDDSLSGNEGEDKLRGDEGNDALDGGFDNDTLQGGTGNDSLEGSRNKDQVFGGDGDDYVNGQGGNDTLIGGDGNDHLYGEAGDDFIDGGAGDDFILSWKGNDVISGGSGHDTFVFAPFHGTDTIEDFTVGEDIIGLKQGLTFTDLSVTQANGDTRIEFGSETLAILKDVTVSRAQIDFVSI